MNNPHRSTIRVPRALWREALELIDAFQGAMDARCYSERGAEQMRGRIEAWLAAAGDAKRERRAQKFTTTLPPGYDERLRAIGDGNASAAIVRLVDEWSQSNQSSEPTK